MRENPKINFQGRWGVCYNKSMGRNTQAKIVTAYDSNAEEVGVEDHRAQFSVMFEEGARVNIVIVDGKVHVEQFRESGDIHMHTTTVDLVG